MVDRTERDLDCVVIGAGIAAIAAGRRLRAAGWSIALLEKSRGIGGRLATRRLDGESFDHGAQFMTAREERFVAAVEAWRKEGWVGAWFGEPERRRYTGLPTMSGFAKRLAEGLDIRNQKLVTNLNFEADRWSVACEDGSLERARRLLVTCPAPQALAILERSSVALDAAALAELRGVRYEKTVALLLRLSEPSGMAAPGFIRFDDPEPIATIADCQRKGTSQRPGIVVHSGHAYADEHYEKSREWLTESLLAETRKRLPVSVEESYLHKWRFAHRSSPDVETWFVAGEELPIWFAGDSYGPAKVEGAYLSGEAAAAAMLSAD